MEKARINSITRLRIAADGEGVRSVIFMQGCPLNCFWCCNPETRTEEGYKTLTPEELYRYVRRDVVYFRASGGGITFSGGEPLIWTDFIHRFIRDCCRDFTVDVETSLDVPEETVRRLAPLVHQWNVDFKVADPEKHRQFTGSTNHRILKNLELLSRLIPRERILITVPVIPGYNDSDEDLGQMMDILRQWGIFRVELHPYRKIAEQKQRSQGWTPREIPTVGREQRKHIVSLLEEGGFTLAERPAPYGKEKCRYLKNLRTEVCQKEQLPVEIARCTVDAPCIGTCPRCEFELDEINRLLSRGEKEHVSILENEKST